jgi:hypothetical protein
MNFSVRTVLVVTATFGMVIGFRHRIIHFLLFDHMTLVAPLVLVFYFSIVPFHKARLRPSFAWPVACILTVFALYVGFALERCFAFLDAQYPRSLPYPDWLVEFFRNAYLGFSDSELDSNTLDATMTTFLMLTLTLSIAAGIFVRAGLNSRLQDDGTRRDTLPQRIAKR